MPPLVTLRKDLRRALRQGHPWVYRDALAAPADLAPGSVVGVAARQGVVAYGFWDRQGPIAVRVLGLAPVGEPAKLIDRRLREALALRQARLDLSRTNAFRW